MGNKYPRLIAETARACYWEVQEGVYQATGRTSPRTTAGYRSLLAIMLQKGEPWDVRAPFIEHFRQANPPPLPTLEPVTQVHFRKFADGDVIAIFPNEEWARDQHGRTVSSYMHIGQHGSASPELIADMAAATPEEYAALKLELESEPYKYRLEVLP